MLNKIGDEDDVKKQIEELIRNVDCMNEEINVYCILMKQIYLSDLSFN